MTFNNFIQNKFKQDNMDANTTLIISVPINSISPNKLNEDFYNKLEDDARTIELAESILFDGLIDLMSVKADPDDADKYILISGHRRLKALNYIVNELKVDSFKLIKVKLLEFESLDHERIALLRANTTQRILKPYDILAHAKEVKRLSEKLYANTNGVGQSRTTAIVAKQLNVSEARVYQLLELDKKLDVTHLEAFKEERINAYTASKIASLKPDQKKLVSDYLSDNPSASEADIKDVVNSEFESKPDKNKRASRTNKNYSPKEDYLSLYKKHIKKFKDDPEIIELEELLLEQINLIFK